MFTLSHQLINLPIISLQTGQVVGTTGLSIVNPDQLLLMGFFVNSGRGKRQSPVLVTGDLRQITTHEVIIDSEDDFSDIDEIVRLKPIIERHFNLNGLSVVNESGTKLGRVEEYNVDLDTYLVQKFYVKPALFKNFFTDSFIVDRSQVIDVTNKQLVVRDASVKKSLLAAQPVTTK